MYGFPLYRISCFLLLPLSIFSQIKEEVELQEMEIVDSLSVTDRIDDDKKLKNQINLSYLYINHDKYLYASDIASFEYIRKEKKNTFVGRLNTTVRNSEVGFQGEIDWYHIFNKSNYIMLNSALSDRFFPKVKGGLSYYHSFKKAWETEIGTRYFYDKFEDESHFFCILGLAKGISQFWLNLRYTYSIEEDFKGHFAFQTRMYMNREQNYITLLAGYGNIPEVDNLNFLSQEAYSVTNVMLGSGYTHQVTQNLQLKFSVNWYRYQVREDRFSNQYHGFILLGYLF